MKKAFIQGIITLLLFLSAWFILSQINWITIFKTQKVSYKTEEKLGKYFWNTIKTSGKENEDPFVFNTIDSIVTKICSKNNIDKNFIKVNILDKDEINAFALPNGHLLIYSGLILAADNPEELSGVIAHEIAHIQLNHVVKKLLREYGLSALISIATGNGESEIIKEAAKFLVSSAFNRQLEKEADIKATEYLVNAKINPEPFANFLYVQSGNEHEITKYLSWISTHPNLKERAKYIIEHNKNTSVKYTSTLSIKTWEKLKEKLVISH